MNATFTPAHHSFDVCVVGGGMAGLCAALAAARHGARTALVQDRPVLGGNASSEIRMWICGAHGAHNKETGLLEEIQLDNQFLNPSLNYSVWDSVLWAKAAFQEGLTLFLNTSCLEAEMQDGRIAAIGAWQLTSQTRHRLEARLFVDCSGDSVLAPLSGAEHRVGREARAEFGEDIEPLSADARTMGNSLLLQLRRTDQPQPYTPPSWAYKFTSPDDLPHRARGVKGDNFWWIEVGGLRDTIRDAEAIRHELMPIVYGVWDYLKNYAPEREEAANWAIEWIGSLPGKRESRRYVGDHVLTQHDVRAGGPFEDIVAYGGWSMDDHHPAGIYYPGQPTIFHPAPSPYGIPYRCLYSRNVPNLMFAGRNISVSHAALSSTRVMATCALLGQAAGTAAALAARDGGAPRDWSGGPRLARLQAALQDDDCWLPGVSRPIDELARAAAVQGGGDGLSLLLDGLDRDRPGEDHAWRGAASAGIEFRWPGPVAIGGVRLVFDSNLNHDKRMPCSYPQKGDRTLVPGSLVRAFRVEAQDGAGAWRVAWRTDANHQRLVRLPLEVRAKALRVVPEASWGDDQMRLFACEPLAASPRPTPGAPRGPSFAEVRARLDEADLRPPDSGLEAGRGRPA
jgi:hypothetical protein